MLTVVVVVVFVIEGRRGEQSQSWIATGIIIATDVNIGIS